MAHLAKPFPLRLEILRDRVAGRIGQTRRGQPASPEDASPVAVTTDGLVPEPSVGVGFAVGAGAETAEEPLIARAIAHELQATLALISGYSQTVQHLPLDNDVRVRYLERISTASSCLSELTDEILTVALSPQRAEEPLLQPVSLRQLYSQIVGQMAAARDRLDVTIGAPADLPLVEADPMWVSLVVRNLLANAAKYAPDSRVVVNAWQNGEWVITCVSDHGTGVEQADKLRVFEPAFRGRRARESGAPGLGLGLYLCSRMVEAHGGRIWIGDSEPGMSVCFSLPRAHRPFHVAGDDGENGLVAVGPGRVERRGA